MTRLIIVDKVSVFKQPYWAIKGIKAVSLFADTDYVYSMDIVGDSYVNYKPLIQLLKILSIDNVLFNFTPG